MILFSWRGNRESCQYTLKIENKILFYRPGWIFKTLILKSNSSPYCLGLGRYGCHLIRYVSRYMQCDKIRITIYRHFDTATLTSPNLVVKSYKNCTFFIPNFVTHSICKSFKKTKIFLKNGPFNIYIYIVYKIFMSLCN